MAASADPSENNREGTSAQKASTSSAPANGVQINSGKDVGNTSGTMDTSKTIGALRHNPGISADWSPEEQSVLEELLAKCESDSNIARYAKIAMQLKDKTVRDVALRARWMTKKENSKRRKEDHSSARKIKDRREKGTESSAKPSSHLPGNPNGSPYAPPMIPVDTDDGISYKAIGGVTGDLLEQNAQMFGQISTNFSAYQVHENISLFCKARDNILNILNDLSDVPEIMKHMPPLPVKMNEELASSILPLPQTHQMNS